jgi:hypothetical protein
MSKTGVRRTGKYEFGHPKLPDPTQALEFWNRYERPSKLVHSMIMLKRDQAVHGIANALGSQVGSPTEHNMNRVAWESAQSRDTLHEWIAYAKGFSC